MIKTLTIMLIIAGLIIFFLILAMIGQLNDLGEYEKRINKAIELIHKYTIDDYAIDYEEVLDVLEGEK